MVLLILIVAETVGIRWWLRRGFYPVIFSGWAVLIYCSIVAADVIVAWLVSMLYAPGGSQGLVWLAVIGVLGARGVRRAVARHPLRAAWRDWVVVISFGMILGVMNYSIYQAFARIPLGIAVTIEFLGPLAVAVASSRRVVDLLWVGLAGAGVLLLSRGGTGTAHGFSGLSTGIRSIEAAAICTGLMPR